jgi:hypothetical protein
MRSYLSKVKEFALSCVGLGNSYTKINYNGVLTFLNSLERKQIVGERINLEYDIKDRGIHKTEILPVDRTIEFFRKNFVPQSGLYVGYCEGEHCSSYKNGLAIHEINMDYGELKRANGGLHKEKPLRTLELKFIVDESDKKR